MELNEAVQWDIDIRSDAEKINLDLEKLNVASIDIECDVAKIDAKLSSLSPSKVFVNVFSDICDIQFSLPKDSGYEITSSSDVTSINTDNKKLPDSAKNLTAPPILRPPDKFFIFIYLPIPAISLFYKNKNFVLEYEVFIFRFRFVLSS